MADTTTTKKTISPETIAEMREFAISGGATRPSTMWEKGQSGNPKGRPRKAVETTSPKPKPDITSTYGASVTSILRKIIKVRKGGGEVEMSTLDALVEHLTQLAFKGNAHAARTLIDEYHREEVRQAKIASDDYEFWMQYRAEAYAELADARRKGLPEPTLLFHPDDIEFGPGHQVRFVGPFREEMQSAVHQAALARDYFEALWGRCVWEWWHQRPKPKGDMPMFLHSPYFSAWNAFCPSG